MAARLPPALEELFSVCGRLTRHIDGGRQLCRQALDTPAGGVEYGMKLLRVGEWLEADMGYIQEVIPRAIDALKQVPLGLWPETRERLLACVEQTNAMVKDWNEDRAALEKLLREV